MGMSKIVNHDLTLRLRWGHDASRQITVPVEYRKGSYSGRYELYIDDVHIGWVVRYDGQTAKRAYTDWDGFLVAEQNGGYQEQVVRGEATRHDAVDWLIYKLGVHARTNVLASRAEAAYADAEEN
jgi:hypothetical protein